MSWWSWQANMKEGWRMSQIITISKQVSPSPNKYHHLHTLSPFLNTNLRHNEQFIVPSPFWRDVGDLCHSICWWYERSPTQYLRDNVTPSNKSLTQLHCKRPRCKVLKFKIWIPHYQVGEGGGGSRPHYLWPVSTTGYHLSSPINFIPSINIISS